MSLNHHLSIIIPCLNEEDTIGTCVSKAKKILEVENIPGEVIVADNGSEDSSIDIAEKNGAKIISVKKKGYGAAIKEGIKVSTGEYILFADADDSYDFSEVGRFYKELINGYDLVQGCRFPSGGGTIKKDAMPLSHRYFGTPVLSLLARVFYKLPFKDIFCGMRAFKKEVYLKSEHLSDGMVFAIENLIKINNFGDKVKEIPITLHKDNRVNTKKHLSTIRDGLRSLKLLLIFCPKYLYFFPSIVLGLISVSYFIDISTFTHGKTGLFLIYKFEFLTYVKFMLSFFTSYQLFMFGLFATYLSNELGFSKSNLIKNPYNFFQLKISLFLSFIFFITGIIVKIYETNIFGIDYNFVFLFLIFFSFINVFNSFLVSLVELISKK